MDAKQSHLEDMNDTMLAAFKDMQPKGVGCLFYIFYKTEGGGGTGFNTGNCNVNDAVIAIERIAEQFGISVSTSMEEKTNECRC